MSLTEKLIETLRTEPQTVAFSDVMAVIEAEYHHKPTAFINGSVLNSLEQNQGSCKILGFARLNGLSEEETLNCFGDYFRQDVLQHPDGTDHANIRAFITTGWAGVQLPEDAVVRK